MEDKLNFFKEYRQNDFCDSCTQTGEVIFCSGVVCIENNTCNVTLMHNYIEKSYSVITQTMDGPIISKSTFENKENLDVYISTNLPNWNGCL